jgi:hypothetical protein
MSAVVKTVKKAAKSVGRVVSKAVNWVVDEVVKPVVDTVERVVEGMLDDPIKTIAQIAAVATGNAWALPLIEGADVAIAGGNVEDVLKATAKAYVAQELGAAAGKYGATEAAKATGSQVAGRVVGSAAASTAAGLVYGRDPVEALKMGLISAGSSELVSATLGKIDQETGGTLAKLRQESPTTAAVIESAITAQISGQDVTAAALSAAIRTSKIATQLVDQFNQDNKNLTPEQATLAANIITNVAATAFAGGDPSRALQATLMKEGSKALGDLVKGEVSDFISGIQKSYKEAELRAQAVDNNISEQERVASEYNKLSNELNVKVTEQDRLLQVANQAKATFEGNKNQTNADAANAAIKAYNNYVDALTKEYNQVYKPKLDAFSNQLSSLQTEYEGLVVDYEKGMQEIQNKVEPLQAKYDELYANTTRAFVQAMDPNFKADEYREINGLGDDVDVYEHWLSEGQFEGLKTNQKDVKVSQAIDTYTQVFGEPPPEHILGKLMDPTNADRDKATELFVDTKIKDRQQQDAYRNSVRSRLIDSYRSEGFSDAQINQKIASGEVDNLTDQIVQDVRTDLSARKEYINQVAERYGTDSDEYKEAYRNTLSGMAETGGFGVVKDGNDFVVDAGARINSETLESRLVHLGDGKGWYDPVTGKTHTPLRIDIAGTGDDSEYSALFALGQSAKPPEQGGESVFGDGSGASPGLFGGFTPIARDQGTGATLYGGDNGFALIAYADGRGAAINTKTNEVIWVTPEKTKDILQKTPVAEASKPVAGGADITVPPAPPPITKPVDTVVEQIKAKIQSPEEVRKAMESLGYKPTDEEVLQFAGEKPADKLLEELTPYIDPRVVTDAEAKEAYKSLGIKNPTQEDVDKIKGQYAQTELAGKAEANLEAARYNSLLQEIQQIQGGAPISAETKAKLDALTEGQRTLAGQLAQQGIDFNKAIDAAKEGITADTQAKFAELDAGQKALAGELTKQGVDLGKAIDTVKADISKEVADKFGTLTAEQKALAGQLAQQGVDLNTAISQAQAQTTQQITGVETRLSDAIKAAEAAGLSRDQAITEAVNAVSRDLGTTKEGLLAQLGTTEAALRQEFATGISGLEAQTRAQYEALTAEQKVLADTLARQGVDLNTAIQTVKGELGGQIAGVSADVQAKFNTLTAGQQELARQLASQGVDLNTAIDTAKAGLTEQIAGVSADLQAKYNTLSAGQKTIADQLAQQGVDLNTAIDTAKTSLAGDIAGVQGDIAGIRGLLQEQEAAAAARAAAQQEEARRMAAAQLGQQRQFAQQTQRQQNVNALQQMLMGAPDIAGQQVTVKAPELARIGYIYDIAGPSIFATPQQEKMFVTPYAQGGAVDADVDDVTAELLKILRS